MAVFSVSFRIYNDASYEKRRDSLVEAIKKEAENGPWDEPTSQAIIESSKSAPGLCDALYSKSYLEETKDLLLVVNLSTKGSNTHASRGAKNVRALDALMAKR